MVWPSAKVTIDFLKSERCPTWPLNRLVLPITRSVLTAVTLTLNTPSTAALISGLVASSGTRNVTWLCCEPSVDFSVTTGERIRSYMRPWDSLTTGVFIGRAQQGSLRSPQFRGGAVIFGPVVRSHAHDLPKKVRKLALKTALSAKAADGRLVVLDRAAADGHKTKALAGRLGKLGWGSVLVIDGPVLDENFRRAAANLIGVDLLPQQGANVYDILRRDTLVLTKDAVKHLEERLQ